MASRAMSETLFLMNNFDPGDCLFLFGFSRGAYTVRTLASLLHMYGLIRKGNEPLVPYAIRMLNAVRRQRDVSSLGDDGALPSLTQSVAPGTGRKAGVFALADDFRQIFSQGECQPWFVNTNSVTGLRYADHLRDAEFNSSR
jgi:T6SS, Phospholipase effector Tle1-like, catalytic domain